MKIRMLVLVILALALSLSGFTADVVSPQQLSENEIREFSEREQKSMNSTEWGKIFKSVDSLNKKIAKPVLLSKAEETQLSGKNNAALEKVVGLGERKAWKMIAFFFPDRILDCLDMVSGGVGIGGGLGAEVHITRWAALGLGGQAVVAAYWYYNRNLAIGPSVGGIAAAGPYQAYWLGFFGAGTGWTKGFPGAGGKNFRKFGKFSYNDRMVNEGWSDPWGVGAGWAAEIHPIEIADFFAGLFTVGFVDISRDDFANPERARYKIGHKTIDWENE